METGISLFYGFNGSLEERAKKIANAGFNRIIVSTDVGFEKLNSLSSKKGSHSVTLKDEIVQAKKNGLVLSSVHFAYRQKELFKFWENGEDGNKQEKSLLNDVKQCKKFKGTCVVVHLSGTPNEIGLERLKRVLRYCNKVKVPLAIENIDDRRIFEYVFDNLEDPYLKICFDSGHQNVFDKDFDYLTKYSDKIITLHLHDNNGIEDEHIIPDYGNIDWNIFAEKLAKTNIQILDWEILMKTKLNLSEEEILKQCFEFSKKLEKKITEIRAETKINK